MKLLTDEFMLDYLDRIYLHEDEGWILRQSVSGRGLRLHVTTLNELSRIYGTKLPIFKTAREAITYYMLVRELEEAT